MYDLFALSTYVMVFLWCADAQRVFLTRPALTVHNIHTLIQVYGALWKSAGLKHTHINTLHQHFNIK